MSQKLSLEQIIEIKAQRYQADNWSLIAQFFSNKVSAVRAKCARVACGERSLPMSDKIAAPATMDLFRKDYFYKHLEAVKTQPNLTVAEQVKLAVHNSLVSAPKVSFISKPEVIENKISALFAAQESATVGVKAADLFHELKVQHETMFVQQISNAVCESAQEIGFENVKMEKTLPTNSVIPKIHIVATNASGQNLVADVVTAKNNTNVNTELLGFTDGSCKTRIQEFEKALERKGIVARRAEQKDKESAATVGIAPLSYAKNVKHCSKSGNRSFQDEEVYNTETSTRIPIFNKK